MTSFIGDINNTIIKLTIYFNSHMRIDEQITIIISSWIHVFIQDHGAYKYENAGIVYLAYFFPKKILKTTIYRLWLLKCVVFNELFLKETNK
jgi:hypothetical protein